MIRIDAKPRRWITQTLKKFLNSSRFMQFTFNQRCDFNLIFNSIRSQCWHQVAQLLRSHKIQIVVWRVHRWWRRASKNFDDRLRMKCKLCQIRACDVLIKSEKCWWWERMRKRWRWNICEQHDNMWFKRKYDVKSMKVWRSSRRRCTTMMLWRKCLKHKTFYKRDKWTFLRWILFHLSFRLILDRTATIILNHASTMRLSVW